MVQALPEASLRSYRTQQAFTAAALLVAQEAWENVDVSAPFESWSEVSPTVTAVLETMQARAAQDGAAMVPDVLAEKGTPVEPRYELVPERISGFAGAGYAAEGVLVAAPIVTRRRFLDGMKPDAALAAGRQVLAGVVRTAMADAGRQGAALGMLTRPALGWVRMLNPPSCSRCVQLAGIASSREPFLRHPRCDCRAVPGVEGAETDPTMNPREYFDSLTAGEQDRIWGRAGARAIRDGADMNQVVNARRGMSTVQQPGSVKWMITNEGMTSRGFANTRMISGGWAERVNSEGGRRRVTRARLMPETIYQVARDEDDARNLLHRYGYIISGRP